MAETTLLAEFDRPEALLDAARRLRAAGHRRFDACSPFPIDGLAEACSFDDNRVPWLTLAGGVLGAAFGFGIQAYGSLAYPIDIGARPLVAWPAFALVTFATTVLAAALFALGGMLVLNRLPRLSHPLFDDPRFTLAGGDRFFLVVAGNQDVRAELTALKPRRISEVAG